MHILGGQEVPGDHLFQIILCYHEDLSILECHSVQTFHVHHQDHHSLLVPLFLVLLKDHVILYALEILCTLVVLDLLVLLEHLTQC